jgi:hypothetical protein
VAKAKLGLNYALVLAKGLDDMVLARYRTEADAVKALCKVSGAEPGALFNGGMRVVCIGPEGPYELIEVFEKLMIRPRTVERR